MGEGGVHDLQAEGWVTLLEHKVPDVQGPIHLGGEENRRPHWAPGAVGEVGHVVPVEHRVPPVRDHCGWGWSERLLSPSSVHPVPAGLQGLIAGRKFFLVSDCQPCQPHPLRARKLLSKGRWVGPSHALATGISPQLSPGDGHVCWVWAQGPSCGTH